LVASGDGVVEILQLQPAGKRSMSAADFLHGYRVKLGERFGS
jgi:methionyl-tRNA formyltransferase